MFSVSHFIKWFDFSVIAVAETLIREERIWTLWLLMNGCVFLPPSFPQRGNENRFLKYHSGFSVLPVLTQHGVWFCLCSSVDVLTGNRQTETPYSQWIPQKFQVTQQVPELG